MSNTFTSVGRAATGILDKVAAERQHRTAIKNLHRKLDIPKGYYQVTYEPMARKLCSEERAEAFAVLVGLNMLPPKASADDVMAAMCARLEKAANQKHGAPKPETTEGQIIWRKTRTEIKEAAITAILASPPHATTAEIAKKAGLQWNSVELYRKKLKAEGKI